MKTFTGDGYILQDSQGNKVFVVDTNNRVIGAINKSNVSMVVIHGDINGEGSLEVRGDIKATGQKPSLAIRGTKGVIELVTAPPSTSGTTLPAVPAAVRIDASDASITVGGKAIPGKIKVRDGSSKDVVTIDGAQGDVILANSDCAEDFEMVAEEQIEPGSVMVLNELGKLVPGTRPYDGRVAGVVSGAGGFKPGVVLGRQPGQADRIPIALAGKVFCKVDADYGSIGVGDLLTTSATRGYAMKASNSKRSFGTVIGKALSPVKSGRSLIPILVALQ